jgi:hypothetical protein
MSLFIAGGTGSIGVNFALDCIANRDERVVNSKSFVFADGLGAALLTTLY